jgi:hypothetical protein
MHLLNSAPVVPGSDIDCLNRSAESEINCNYSLPNGLYLAGVDNYISVTSPTLIPGDIPSIAFPDIPVVLDFVMVYFSFAIGVAAIETSLSLCG